MNVRTSILNKDVANRLTALRKMTKLNQREFSSVIGYGHQRYCSFESGRCPIPFYVLNLVIQTIAMYGITATQEWLLHGQGATPHYLSEFESTINSLAEKTTQDPLAHFFLHALSLSKLYKDKLTLFEGGSDYEPHIPAGTFMIAPKVSVNLFNPNWKGYYLVEHRERIFLALLVRTAVGAFNITSLHTSEKKRVVLKEQRLSHIYPAIGLLSHYNLRSSTASDIVKALQHQTLEYASSPMHKEEA